MDSTIASDPQDIVEDGLTYLKRLHEACNSATKWVQKASLQDKERWDAIMTWQEFEVGDHVLLWYENRFSLEYNWMGPYVVLEKNPNVDIYKIETLDGTPYTSWVHTDHLKPAYADKFQST
ncbi:hypothetical protein DFQ30_003918, partial [Apophysomyces sp. BC1015]